MHSLVSRRVAAILLVAIVASCSGMQPPAKPPVDQAAISASVDSAQTAWAGAVAARDTTLLVNCYAGDAHVLAANAPRADGTAAIREGFVGFLSTPGLDIKLASNTKIISEAGDLVVDLGSYEMSFQDAKGKPMHDVGKYTTIFKRVNGEWKIVVDTWNSDTPLPGM